MLLTGLSITTCLFILSHLVARWRPVPSWEEFRAEMACIYFSQIRITEVEEALREKFVHLPGHRYKIKNTKPRVIVFVESSSWRHWGYFYGLKLAVSEHGGTIIETHLEPRFIPTGSDTKYFDRFTHQLERFVDEMNREFENQKLQSDSQEAIESG